MGLYMLDDTLLNNQLHYNPVVINKDWDIKVI